jgi:hypothetical protein
MADTQWRTGANAGDQPASCATRIIDALNSQFMHQGVKFVIQVGDLVDVEVVGSDRTLPTRAAHAQALYDAGTGFFTVRGNHEGSQTAAGEIPKLFPQTLGKGPNVYGAENFQSPILTATSSDPSGKRLNGLSYSFVHSNVRFILIDQFTRPDGSNYDGTTSNNNNLIDQLPWIDSTLDDRTPGQHTFVFSHKNLAGQNHKDVLFGANLSSNEGARNDFISSLNAGGVRYHMSGHDHMHHRSLIETTDGKSSVGQIICSSNSYKFYIPASPYDTREKPVAQELFTIGYYIVTVDGPRVTVDFYSSSHGQKYGDTDLVMGPANFAFYHRESFGYSLNGKEFRIARGGSYTSIQDRFNGTSARILSGQNGDSHTDYGLHPLMKTVNTGWTRGDRSKASHILSLWGIRDNLSYYDASLTGSLPNSDYNNRCDAFTLSLSFGHREEHVAQFLNGRFGLAAKNWEGRWVNAVDLNASGTKKPRVGMWQQGDPLGTYGIDPVSRTVWAVIDYDGEFAATHLR